MYEGIRGRSYLTTFTGIDSCRHVRITRQCDLDANDISDTGENSDHTREYRVKLSNNNIIVLIMTHSSWGFYGANGSGFYIFQDQIVFESTEGNRGHKITCLHYFITYTCF